MLNVLPGTTLSVKEKFVDEYGVPLIPDTAPIVQLIDNTEDIVTTTYAVPDTVAGTWITDVTVPKFDNKDSIECVVRWIFISNSNTYYSKESIIVEPSVEERETEAVVLIGDGYFTINVPFVISPTDTPPASFEFYQENTQLYAAIPSGLQYIVNNYTTNVRLPITVTSASLSAHTLLVRYNKPTRLLPETLTYKVWVVNPSILNAMSRLENFVNKSRISNVIPELRYAASDLILALSQGLNTFNSLLPTITTFTGLNMQGVLLDAWLITSAIALLNAQYMAEGSLAFDFSGQSVSLNIDRTQYIEAMLGRLDALVDSQVKPLKQLLGKTGNIGGDGGNGSNISGSNGMGMLSLTLAPTTRLFGNAYASTGFRRYW